ncbi:MgtC/SapB family protein [Cohnella fermenti]|uniref:MgtC/SapB family protein n=1 Tax=Cohnella fermenti TaxID=2565925 RepID=A0A4S4BVJ7_9BACL|nr:MgtC/SapB family protein [Cohnella fermenti]THF79124.1 MgtC/SapB family protein [Cohnella fermenti]
MLIETGSVWEISWLDLVLRMALSAVLGGVIGMEREWNNHAAGFRTHILVCLGSTTIMLLSSYGFSSFVSEVNVRIDPARLAAQVISGIGFLGAGAIMRNGNMVKGLTTAASVWTVAAIGLCAGAGFYEGALVCTLMVLISLYVLNKWEKALLRHRRYQSIELQVTDSPGLWGRIAAAFEQHNVQVSNMTVAPYPPNSILRVKLKSFRMNDFLEAMEEIGRLDGVEEIDSDSMIFAAKKADRHRNELQGTSISP